MKPGPGRGEAGAAPFESLANAPSSALLERRESALRGLCDPGTVDPTLRPELIAAQRPPSPRPLPTSLHPQATAPAVPPRTAGFPELRPPAEISPPRTAHASRPALCDSLSKYEPSQRALEPNRAEERRTKKHSYFDEKRIWEDRWNAAIESLRLRRAEPAKPAELGEFRAPQAPVFPSALAKAAPAQAAPFGVGEGESERARSGEPAAPATGFQAHRSAFSPIAPAPATQPFEDVPEAPAGAMDSTLAGSEAQAHLGRPPRPGRRSRALEEPSQGLPRAESVGPAQVRTRALARPQPMTLDEPRVDRDPDAYDFDALMPSIRTILDNRRVAVDPTRADAPARTRGSRGSRSAPCPLPTAAIEPLGLRIKHPNFVKAACLFLLCATGAPVVFLSWAWNLDDQAAESAAGQLALAAKDPEAAAKLKDFAESAPAPREWWRTTPAHLGLMALIIDRSASPGERDRWARALSLLDAARDISAADPPARLARAEVLSATGAGAAAEELVLGLPREVDALALAARRLRANGKRAQALALFRKAFAMAAEFPIEFETPRLTPGTDRHRRYPPPRELALDAMARDLIDDPEGSLEEWSRTIPEEAACFLALGRALSERSAAEAVPALEKAQKLAAAKTSGPVWETAIARAIEAEAYAIRGELEKGRERYKLAADLMPIESIRRSWLMNIADLSARIGDLTSAREAWDEVRADGASDSLARRAEELRIAALSAKPDEKRTADAAAEVKLDPLGGKSDQ